MTHSTQERLFHFLGLAVLIVAGEAIFSLPYNIVRFFRPTFLEVFQVTNTQIGQAQSTYGIVAMASYFLGGPLADRFAPKYLIIIALLLTAAGGLYFATIPGILGLHLLYGFWGCSTILLFWSALIKATRGWGEAGEQGRAFGFLEAGRGLFAAVLSSLAFLILAYALPDQIENLQGGERREAMQQIIYVYVMATVVAAMLVLVFLDAESADHQPLVSHQSPAERLRQVFANRLIWPQMFIVVCAYVGYKGVDNYVLYATQAYGLDEVAASGISTSSSWIRPLAAIAAGILADKLSASRVVIASFAIMCLGYAVFACVDPSPGLRWMLVTNIAITSMAVYALRAVYFALLSESAIPLPVTGTAIGVISVVGYTPDVFFAPAMGWLLDNHAVVQGHQWVFGLLCAFAIAGLVSGIVFAMATANRRPLPASEAVT